MKFYVQLIEAIRELRDREDGVTAIEYGLLAVLIALAMAAGATLAGTALDTMFTDIAGDLN